jgi:hypothetical protein
VCCKTWVALLKEGILRALSFFLSNVRSILNQKEQDKLAIQAGNQQRTK